MFSPKTGDRIVIKLSHLPGKWDPDRLDGKHGTFLEFTRTGYARVAIDGNKGYYVELVQPESLQPEVEDKP